MQIHPAQISPGEPFDVFYFLRNHTDGATYYVRALVYDVRSGEILKTVDLEQSATNSRLFIKTVQAPPDPVGFGRNIVAVATVYTDSGYTTKSQDYEEQEQYFLIRAEPPVFGGGGVDYGALREIMEEVVDKRVSALPKPEPVTLPEFPDMPFDTVFGAIGALAREVNRIPKKSPDLTPLNASLTALREAIEAIPEPTGPADLSPVLDALSAMETGLSEIPQAIKEGDAAVIKALQSTLVTMIPRFADQVSQRVEETIQGQELSIPFAMKVSPRKQEAAQPDISRLFK